MSCPNNLFEGDTYDTPPGRRSWEDRLLLGNRFHFYLRNFWIFCQTGCCARRGHLTAERQIHYSNGNIRLVEACGGIIHLRGLDHLRQLEGRPVILMGNHMSMLETAVFHAIVRPHLDFTFVIKQSLLKVPFFGWIMQSLAAIPVGRSNPREDLKAVLTKLDVLSYLDKIPVCVAYDIDGERVDRFPIGVKLAKAAGVEIVPFALKTDFIGNGKYLRDFGPIHRDRQIYFEFGAPVRVEGNGKQELQQLTAFTADRLNRWAQEQAVR